MRRLTIVLGLTALALLAAPAPAQDTTEGEEASPPSREEILRRNREVWERMSPEERKRALERLKRFRRMSEEDRERVVEKARRLVGNLDPETRERIAHRKRWEDMRRAMREMKQLLGRVRQRMPEDLRSWIGSLEGRERHMLERLVLSKLFGAQTEAARKHLGERTLKRIERAAGRDRRAYVRLLFETYRRSILKEMPEREKERITTLPEPDQRKARQDYARRAIGSRLVEQVSRTVVPDLRKLREMPEDERVRALRTRMGHHRSARRGMRGLRGFPVPERTDRRKLREMTEDERRAWFRALRERQDAWLHEKGVSAEELERLRALPPDRFWPALRKAHPEWWEDARRRGPRRERGRDRAR